MANLNNNPFIHDTGLNEENSLMHLLDVISPDEEDKAILLEHSKYFDDLSFKNTLCKQNGKISVVKSPSGLYQYQFHIVVLHDSFSHSSHITVV